MNITSLYYPGSRTKIFTDHIFSEVSFGQFCVFEIVISRTKMRKHRYANLQSYVEAGNSSELYFGTGNDLPKICNKFYFCPNQNFILHRSNSSTILVRTKSERFIIAIPKSCVDNVKKAEYGARIWTFVAALAGYTQNQIYVCRKNKFRIFPDYRKEQLIHYAQQFGIDQGTIKELYFVPIYRPKPKRIIRV